MRPRTEAALAVVALTLLAFGVALLARPGARATPSDPRASTLLAGPEGARGLLEGVRALGITVRRFRERPRALAALDGPRRQALVLLDPSADLSPPEVAAVLAFGRHADLILAGDGAEPLLRCFGYRLKRRAFDSVPATSPREARSVATAPWVHAELVATGRLREEDSTRVSDIGSTACSVPSLRARDLLLVTPDGAPVALTLTRADVPQRVVLLADANLLRNRALRRTAAGPFALRLFQGRYDRVIFEEYHHGFGPQGSLAAAALAWSRRSPWGWLVWQLAAVGVLALLFGGIRFGRPRPIISRTRRSPLEHVHALAVALSAAQGHDEAIGALVRGLRRRLAPAALRGGARREADWRTWLARLTRATPSPSADAALNRLAALGRAGQPATSVLHAANAVEDLWQELRP